MSFQYWNTATEHIIHFNVERTSRHTTSCQSWNNVTNHHVITTLKQRHDTQSNFNVEKTSQRTSLFKCGINIATHNVISKLKESNGIQRHFSVDTTLLHTIAHWNNVIPQSVITILKECYCTQVIHCNVGRTSRHTTSFQSWNNVTTHNDITTLKQRHCILCHFKIEQNVTWHNFISQLKPSYVTKLHFNVGNNNVVVSKFRWCCVSAWKGIQYNGISITYLYCRQIYNLSVRGRKVRFCQAFLSVSRHLSIL